MKDRENLLKRAGAVSAGWKVDKTDLLTSGLIGSSMQIPNAGDIVIEYHPHSKRGTRIISSEEFKASLGDNLEPSGPPDSEPWHPFHSREDFEFAEIVHDAALNRGQIERMIKLIQSCQDKPGKFTFESHNDLKLTLESTSKLLTPVTIYLPPVPNRCPFT